jgi:hypothetical protein
MKTLRLTAALAISMLAAGPAAAQATRTWVSGVGDDANPCSRTAPCKTFAGAISKTAPGGEIDVLDPGGFGAVTITKSISIEADGVIAGVLVAGTNGIVVQAGPTDTVILRGLTIEGLYGNGSNPGNAGINGIRWLSGKNLVIERCTIHGFAQVAIDAEPGFIAAGQASNLFVSDTQIRDNAGGGILAKPTGGNAMRASITRVNLNHNLYGVRAETYAYVTVKDSVAAQGTQDGFIAQGSTGNAVMYIENSAASNNGQDGVHTISAASLAFISNMIVTGNNIGLHPETGGIIASWGNNKVDGNLSSDGSPTSTIGAK